MPLRATSGDTNVHAFDFDEDRWTELKSTYRALRLAMPCCGRAAIPKTSTLGNHFFAHSREGSCTSAPESAQHLYCKQLIAQAAKAAGWSVVTERHGVCPQGEEWIADVFCERGNAKIAFEVQMSSQTHDETLRRQRRYRDSGVRGAWFHAARKSDYQVHTDKETPSFVLTPVEIGVPPQVKGFAVDLSTFVMALLLRRVTWETQQYTRTVHVEYLRDTCWACQKPVKQVCGMTSSDDPHWWFRPMTVPSLSQMLLGVDQSVQADELRAQGLNEIGKQQIIQEKRTHWPHCNLCLHCRAPQNNYHVAEKLREAFQSLDRGDADFESPLGTDSFERVERGMPRWVYRELAAATEP
jgi:hypothetical protein